MNTTTRFPHCRVLRLFLFLLSMLVVAPGLLCAANLSANHVPDGVNASDWQSIRAAHEAWKHAMEPVTGGWQARNPAQQWTTMFDGRGFVAKPQSADWTWGLELRSYGAGGEQREVGGKPAVKAEGHRLAYHWDETVQEWFVNDSRGLEHGFSVQERPPGPVDAPLTFVLATRGPLRAAVAGDARSVDYRDKSGATVLTYSGLRVWDADGRELEARFAPAEDGVVLQVEAQGARYPLLIDPLAQQAYLKASNTGAGDLFGASVAIDFDTVVVGAPSEDSSATGVNGDQSNNSAPDSGAAYVFVRNGGTWTQQAYLKASNTQTEDYFGTSVAVNQNTVVVGAPGEDSSATRINGNQSDNSAPFSGAAYVFVRNGGTWTQQAYLKPSNAGAGDEFGNSVGIAFTRVLVGAPFEDSSATGVNGNQSDNSAANSGAAYIFLRNGARWTQESYLKASNTGAADQFGYAVAINSRTALVGAPDEDSNAKGINGSQGDNGADASGAAYLFRRVDRTWAQEAYLKASNTGTGDKFGTSVALDSLNDRRAVVGAPGEDSNATGVDGDQNNENSSDSGAAYLFGENPSTATLPWRQTAYLKASNTGPFDQFGISVAASRSSSSVVVVGAYQESGSATGINGANNNAAGSSGAAYVFIVDDFDWRQQAYLKAPNTGAQDLFGYAVAVFYDTVVVGAYQESGSATGVNGANNNAAGSSGAAYVLNGFGPPPDIAGDSFEGMLGVPLEFRIKAYGAEPDGYGATGLPAGLSVNPNTGFITGTPSQAGQSFVTLTATNAGGTGSVVSRLIIHPAGPASITSLELLPASGSATAGRSTRLTLLVRNTSTEPQTLPVIFSSSDPAVPAPGQRSDTLALRAFMLEVPGKRSASEESAVSRHRISFYVASTASGPLQITAYGSATLKSTSSLNIRPARRQ